MKTMGPWPHTSEEYEKHHIAIAKALVEENDAQLIFCSCAYNMIMLPPGAKERIAEGLPEDIIVITDPTEIALNTLEMLVKWGLSHSKIEYPQMVF